MTPILYLSAAALALVALALIVVPLLRYRKEGRTGTTLTAIVLLFPLAIGLIYANVTSYPWDDQSMAQTAATGDSAPPVEEMIVELAERLKTQPDAEGYILLARSYIRLQRFPDAVDAWHRAWELTEGNSPEVSLGYAEALILADQRSLKTSAGDLLDEVLQVMPDDPRALWYGGISAAARGLNDVAIARYSKLLQAEELPDNMRLIVQEQLAQLGADAPDAPVAMDAPAAETEEGAGLVLNVTIDIDPTIAELAAPGATLFLFARDADQPGPPIAVKRVRPKTYPIEIRLSNANAMVAGRKLESAKTLEVVARISPTGNAIEAAGDLYGDANPETGAGVSELDLAIVIDSVVQ